MNLDTIVAQLQANTTMFLTIGGAAAYATAVDPKAVNVKLPAAFVIANASRAGENLDMNGLQQNVEQVVSIFVVLSNADDRQGQAASASIYDAQTQLRSAILNWRPDFSRGARGFAEGDSQHVEMSRGTVTHVFHFVLQTTITDADGYQPPGDDLDALVLKEQTYGVNLNIALPQS